MIAFLKAYWLVIYFFVGVITILCLSELIVSILFGMSLLVLTTREYYLGVLRKEREVWAKITARMINKQSGENNGKV